MIVDCNKKDAVRRSANCHRKLVQASRGLTCHKLYSARARNTKPCPMWMMAVVRREGGGGGVKEEGGC